MTRIAAEFYTGEAQGLGVVPPPIFNGPLPLLGEGQVLSPLAPGEIGQQLTRDFNAVLESVVPFVIAHSDAVPLYYDKTVMASNARNVASITGAMLLPRSVKGGRISGLTIEAIAPGELVLPGMLSAFGPATNSLGIRDDSARRVFMIVSGMHEERRFVSKPCAGIAGVYLNTKNHTGQPTPRFVAGALSQTLARQWHDEHSQPCD